MELLILKSVSQDSFSHKECSHEEQKVIQSDSYAWNIMRSLCKLIDVDADSVHAKMACRNAMRQCTELYKGARCRECAFYHHVQLMESGIPIILNCDLTVV